MDEKTFSYELHATVSHHGPFLLVQMSSEWDDEPSTFVLRKSALPKLQRAKFRKLVGVLLDTPGHVDTFHVPTKEYMCHYFENSRYEYKGKVYYEDVPETVQLLHGGHFDRFTLDKSWYDGFFYREDGTPIIRKLWFDYIGGISGVEADMTYYAEVLVKHDQVADVRVEKIPWYNSARGKTHGIVFSYLPTQEELNEWVKEDDFDRTQKLLARLVPDWEDLIPDYDDDEDFEEDV